MPMVDRYNFLHEVTLCSGNTSITVHGDSAKAIEIITVTTVCIIAIATIIKTLQ